ncbi:hypothetical protein GRF29_1g1889347 [Pseudopithomyces chartarum]|uniref:Uncharacterized protein n=1 Tax=Pseudopithomyces chartarum TaxID=1892770 RepID=A0AAN6RN67_9PLEO|nr:hypothetical protein GRF29_1g1889347 [Pseudopithomyces chartarum]
MASRSTLFSLTAILLSAHITMAAPGEPSVASKMNGYGYGHSVEPLTLTAIPGGEYGYDTPAASLTLPEENYGSQPSAEPTPEGSYGNGYGNGYQVSSEPTPSIPSITTPEIDYPTVPYSSEATLSLTSSRNCTNTTTTVTIPYPSPSPSTSHTCHNTTITSTISTPIFTPSASPSRNCTTKSTMTVTIPWPGTGSGYLPSATGSSGYGQGPHGNETYHQPTLSAEAPPSATNGYGLGPETTSEPVSTSVAEDTPTPVTEPSLQTEPSLPPETSGNVPPAPPAPSASSTGPEEPLFAGGAVRMGSGAGLAVVFGAMVALL